MIETMPRIGDEVYVHGYIDEIRKDIIIIRNEGGYFGTVFNEVIVDRKTESDSETPSTCEPCKHSEKEWHEWPCGDCKGWDMYEPKTEPQTDCPWSKGSDAPRTVPLYPMKEGDETNEDNSR